MENKRFLKVPSLIILIFLLNMIYLSKATINTDDDDDYIGESEYVLIRF